MSGINNSVKNLSNASSSSLLRFLMPTASYGFLLTASFVWILIVQLKLIVHVDDKHYVQHHEHGSPEEIPNKGMPVTPSWSSSSAALLQQYTNNHHQDNHGKENRVDVDYSSYHNNSHYKTNKDENGKQRRQKSRKVIQKINNATTNNECTLSLFSNRSPSCSNTLARIIVFQRDGGKQLQNLMTHYKHVLEYDDIVIIDHLGVDKRTQSILTQYSRLGAHVWRCHGPWKRKAEMWSDVTRIYAPHSKFVFPLDVDEFIGVIRRTESATTDHSSVNTNKAQKTKQQQGKESIQWNRVEFENALHRIPHTGKPIKMEKAEPVPLDCNIDSKRQSPQDLLHNINIMNSNGHLGSSSTNTTTRTPSSLMTGDACDLQFMKRRHSQYEKMITKGFATGRVTCMDKTFAFGQDFNSTDTGNHCGGTWLYPQLRRHMFECPKRGIRNMYDISDLVLVHFQSVTFQNWLLHGLRGAADKGYNKPGLNCTKGANSVHYCRKWQAMHKVRFDPYKSRQLFLKDVCPNKKFHDVFSIQGLMGPSCLG